MHTSERLRLQLALLGVLASVAHAGGTGGALSQAPGPAGEDSPARSGFYLDLHGTWAQMGGDFDGNTLLVGSTDSIAVPDAGSGVGFGLAFGHRWERQALELSFTETQHDGSIPGSSGGDVTFDLLELNWRYFFRPEAPLQPFFQAGIGAAFATLEDASTNGVEVGDADLSGGEISLGGGVEYYFARHWSAGLRALYSFTFYDTAEGVAGNEGSLDETVDSSGVALVFGLAYTF